MKVALITGASGGIGRETVKRFVKNGYFTIGIYNSDKTSIDNLINELKNDALEGYFFGVQADFCNDRSVDDAIKTIKENFNHIDVLVNNAGVSLYKLVTDTTPDEWDTVFSVNVKSAFRLISAFLPTMIDRQNGAIVNVSSVWGQVGASMETVYSASKSALIGFTKALAKEVAPSNIRVNCVCPGVIDTKMNDIFTDDEKSDIVSAIPLNRMGSAKEIAELIYFLATEKSAYITGQTITADGGYTL